MSLFGEPTARESLVWQIRAQIRRLAMEGFGAREIQMPIAQTSLTRPGVDDALAGIGAARLMQRVAEAVIADYAVAARAAGRTWTEIGAALGITGQDWPGAVAERAFDQVTHGGDGWSRSSVRWRCPSCGEQITDSGPFTSHPADIESGHADGCARYAADVAAWAEQAGWAD